MTGEFMTHMEVNGFDLISNRVVRDTNTPGYELYKNMWNGQRNGEVYSRQQEP